MKVCTGRSTQDELMLGYPSLYQGRERGHTTVTQFHSRQISRRHTAAEEGQGPEDIDDRAKG